MDKFNFILVILFFFSSASYAEDKKPALESTGQEFADLHNPFESRLPKKQVEKAPEIIEPPSVEIPVVPDSAPVSVTPVPEPDLTQFKILGLVWNTDRPQAIINDQIYNIGDSINGLTIVSIQKTGIEIAINEKVYTIKP